MKTVSLIFIFAIFLASPSFAQDEYGTYGSVPKRISGDNAQDWSRKMEEERRAEAERQERQRERQEDRRRDYQQMQNPYSPVGAWGN